MNTADPDGPNYLKPPAPEVGWGANREYCQHNIQPHPEPTDRAQYWCTVCKIPFPQSLIEEVDGQYRMKDFSKYGRGPRRR